MYSMNRILHCENRASFLSLYKNLFLFLCLIRQISLISDSDYYEGTGYAKVALERFPTNLLIQQKVETRAKDALLLYLGDETNVRTVY